MFQQSKVKNIIHTIFQTSMEKGQHHVSLDFILNQIKTIDQKGIGITREDAIRILM